MNTVDVLLAVIDAIADLITDASIDELAILVGTFEVAVICSLCIMVGVIKF